MLYAGLWIGRCRAVALALLVLSAPALADGVAPQPAPAASGEPTRFLRTVVGLVEADEASRSAFAALSLSHLAIAHHLEAETARSEPPLGDRRKVIAWASAVDRYGQGLAALAEAIHEGFPVTLMVTPLQQVAVAVDERLVILSHPRREQQSTLEQEILRDFCAQHACDRMAASDADDAQTAMSAAFVRPTWSFTEDGLVCAHSGISLRFPPGGKLVSQKALCTDLVRELSALLAEVRWQMRHAVKIEWDSLQAFETPARPEHRIQLNEAGDSVLMKAPLLARNPGLLQRAAHWIRMQLVLGEHQPALVLEAENLQH